MDQQFSTPEVTSDDRLWALLSYLLTPIIPIVILLMPDKKDRPFLKAHTMQSLLLGVAEIIIESILGVITAGILGCVVWVAAIVINIYYALKANKGEVFEIPVITNFIRQQGW